MTDRSTDRFWIGNLIFKNICGVENFILDFGKPLADCCCQTEQNYAVKGRSIQNNLDLICKTIEGIEDDTRAALNNLDQSKAFDRVNHRFLAAVLETVGFEPELHRWINIL